MRIPFTNDKKDPNLPTRSKKRFRFLIQADFILSDEEIFDEEIYDEETGEMRKRDFEAEPATLEEVLQCVRDSGSSTVEWLESWELQEQLVSEVLEHNGAEID
jgi:hypothetical protein